MQHKWPTYEVASDDAIYALGVVSINYTRFERAQTWVMAAVGRLPEDEATKKINGMATAGRLKAINAYLSNCGMAELPKNHVKHFLSAMAILAENRNRLIHANIIRGLKGEPAIYRIDRKGMTTLTQGSINLFRTVADDLNAYFYYGLHIANMIFAEFQPEFKAAGMIVYPDWPGFPPMPQKLDEQV
jgi:hypothetical protein